MDEVSSHQELTQVVGNLMQQRNIVRGLLIGQRMFLTCGKRCSLLILVVRTDFSVYITVCIQKRQYIISTMSSSEKRRREERKKWTCPPEFQTIALVQESNT